MYAQVAIKPNPLLRNGAYGIVMRGVQKCTRGCSSLRGRNKLPLCCIKLDTATDPFCGSGTFLIEAALVAMNIAPGINRRFDCERWGVVPQSVWKEARQEALSAIDKQAGFHGFGYDIDDAAVELTMDNAKKAGVSPRIRVEKRDIRSFATDLESAVIYCNPPYGERMLEVKEAREIYHTMGKVFEHRKYLKYYIISPDEDFERIFGRKADKRRKLYNGMLKCQLYMYFK